jgi:hypothetical protein
VGWVGGTSGELVGRTHLPDEANKRVDSYLVITFVTALFPLQLPLRTQAYRAKPVSRFR